MTGFWAPAPSLELSPGDLLTGALIGSSEMPPVPLKLKSFKAGETAWAEIPWTPDGNGRGNFLAVGRMVAIMVISHGCEIDKKDGKSPILVAPVFPISALSQDHQTVVRAGERHAFLPVPEVAGHIAESYVDLRLVSYLQRPMIQSLTRAGSATLEGQDRLAAHLIGFLTRIDLDKLLASVPK